MTQIVALIVQMPLPFEIPAPIPIRLDVENRWQRSQLRASAEVPLVIVRAISGQCPDLNARRGGPVLLLTDRDMLARLFRVLHPYPAISLCDSLHWGVWGRFSRHCDRL